MMANYGNYYTAGGSAPPIGFADFGEPPPPYEQSIGGGYQNPTSYSGGSYPASPPVAPIQGVYVPSPQQNAYPNYQAQPSNQSMYSNYTPPAYGGQQGNVYSNYSPQTSYDTDGYGQQQVHYDQQGGGHKKSGGGGLLNNIGGFASKNKMEIAGAALSYKMGGKIGKVMAAGMGADLVHKYQKDQKRSKSPQPHSVAQGSQAGVKSHGVAGDLMTSGQQLFGKAEKYVGGFLGGGTSKQLQSGCVVQLVSQITGKALQIVKSRDGRLMLDALGMESPQAFNAHFTVVKEADKVILLHNNNNFISIMGGQLTLFLAGGGGQPSYQCRFRVHEPQTKMVSFESVAEPGVCIGIAPNGEPNFGTAMRHNDYGALFTLRTVYNPHQ